MDARVIEAADVTEQVVSDAVEIVDGWYAESRVDWDDVWDRLERQGYDFGTDSDSPAMRKIKRQVQRIRREG